MPTVSPAAIPGAPVEELKRRWGDHSAALGSRAPGGRLFPTKLPPA